MGGGEAGGFILTALIIAITLVQGRREHALGYHRAGMALGVLTFIGSWNSFLWPLVIGQDPSTWTVQVVLSTFLTSQTQNLAQLFAAAAVGVLPLVLVFLVMQRYIVEGAKFSGGKE